MRAWRWLAVCWLPCAVAAGEIELTLADLAAPSFHARDIRATLGGPDWHRFRARIGEVEIAGRVWREVELGCDRLRLTPARLACDAGELALAGERWPASFSHDRRGGGWQLALRPAPGESWQLTAQPERGGWRGALALQAAAAQRLAAWLPANWPLPGGGRVDGRIEFVWPRAGEARIELHLSGERLAFADAAGQRAGEGLKLTLRAAARGRDERWHWQAEADWRGGEIYWQPIYLAGNGQRLAAQGELNAQRLTVSRARLSVPDTGVAEFSGAWRRPGGALAEARLGGRDLDLASLWPRWLQPWWPSLAGLAVNGRADLDWTYRDGATRRLAVRLRGADLDDAAGRYALHGVEADIPWQADGAGRADIRFTGGRLLRLPFGAARIDLGWSGGQYAVAALDLPLLDGQLSLRDFAARRERDGWQWRFGAQLAGVSMESFSAAMGWPAMRGELSAGLPRVRYGGGQLTLDGVLFARLFDGTVVVRDLLLRDPLGPAPRLAAGVEMRNLDLDRLTRAFAFGSISGRIDIDVAGLELSAWRPVRFDARLASSPGDYPRRISQRAVENISALGGASAAAAIQRSFLRFFEEFGYARIGLSCALRGGICRMDGIEPAGAGYRIVEGGGIPAINVIGYNRAVGWDELIGRLARITGSNVKPVIE